MSEESGKVDAVIAGVLGSIRDSKTRDHEFIAAILSNEIADLNLSSNGLKELARVAAVKGFDGDPREFVFAFWRYQEKLHEDQDAFTGRQRETLDQLLLGVVTMIHSDLGNGLRLDDATIEAAVTIRALVSAENNGRASQLIRRCGEVIDETIVDRYCEDHPYNYSPWNCQADSVREWLLEGVFRRLGFWRIWCLVRKFFLGRKPEQAEAEMYRQREIEAIHNKLEGSWMHKIPLNTIGQAIMDKETKLIQRLVEIDDEGGEWVMGNIPPWRKGDNG